MQNTACTNFATEKVSGDFAWETIMKKIEPKTLALASTAKDADRMLPQAGYASATGVLPRRKETIVHLPMSIMAARNTQPKLPLKGTMKWRQPKRWKGNRIMAAQTMV